MQLVTESNQTIEILTIGELYSIYIRTESVNLVREQLNNLDVIDFITNIETECPSLILTENELDELNLFGVLLEDDSNDEWKK